MRHAAILRLGVFFLVTGGLGLCGTGSVWAQSDQEAENQAQIGLNAQREKDFETALDAWTRICRDYPQSRHYPKAHLFAGVCATQLKKYEAAIDFLSQAIQRLSPEEIESLGSAHLHLGYSQFERGKSLLQQNDSAAGRPLLTAATKTFQNQLERYAQFKDNDQAAYFQGLAFEQLQQLPEAALAYEKMLTYPQPTFRFAGLFALANVLEQQGQFASALQRYREYLDAAEKAQSPPADVGEVRFRTAETLWQLAMEARRQDDSSQFEKLANESQQLLESLVTDLQFPFRDDARFRLGLIASQRGDHDRSAKLFGELAMGQSPRADQAALFAGREMLAAGQLAEAEKWFSSHPPADSKYSVEAAHWLVQAQLQAGRAREAYQTATAALAQSQGTPWEMELGMDQAEAAWQQTADPDLRQSAPDLFLANLEKFPQHPLAGSALYNAAFALLELKQFDEALQLASRFEKQFADHEFLPDVQEVQADALIGMDRPAEAAPLLLRLGDQQTRHPKRQHWQVRAALTYYLAGDFPTATEMFARLAPTLKDKLLAAEAYHWLGACYFQQQNYADAIAAFGNSRAASTEWRRAAETLSLLSQAQTAAGQSADAEQTLTLLKQAFPEHESAAEAELRLAKQAFQSGEFQRAIAIYDRLSKNASPELTPHVLYDSAWCLAKLADSAEDARLKDAEQRFRRVITDFPQHALAPLARLGRSAVLRQADRLADALAELDQFLEQFGDHARAADAQYERGLALVQLKRWPEAIAQWQSLLRLPAASEFLDRVHYELAWAHRENQDPEAAWTEFALIAEQFPTSAIAPDAFFQLGERDYAAGNLKTASNWYQRCLAAKPNPGLAEKALYKLGFSHFREKQFTESLKTFRQQVEEFPQGDLLADGLFMIGESLFEAKQFDAALAAYRVAKPAVESSPHVKPENRWLTWLHAAQSANQQNDFSLALQLATDLAEDETADSGLRCDAWLEVGNAQQGLKQLEPAVEAWTKATASIDKTGARAHCMLGEALFARKEFNEAIKQFKQVYFGFGGEAVDEEIDPWQAFAAYEIARCHYVQISAAEAKSDAGLSAKLLEETIRWFELLVEKFPHDRLVADARRELDKLKKISSRR